MLPTLKNTENFMHYNLFILILIFFKYRIYLYKRPLPINCPLLSTFSKFIFQGFTYISIASTFTIPGFWKKMHFSTSRIEYHLWEIKKSKQDTAIFITDAMKFAKIWVKLYNFFKFKVCFQYRKLSHYYTYWQARSRLKVSIIAQCRCTRELIFLIGYSRPSF